MSVQDPPAVWEDGRWAGLPSLDGDIDVDVCVVGLGGSGLSCIHELRDHGVRDDWIDAPRPLCGHGRRKGGAGQQSIS